MSMTNQGSVPLPSGFTASDGRGLLTKLLGQLRSPYLSRIVAVSYTAGGWQLRNFAADHELDRVLHEAHWDVVVLQEQSQIPSFAPDYRARGSGLSVRNK